MTETDAEKAYVKLQQAQDCYNEPWPQLKVLEHEKLYVLNSSRVFVG